MINITSKKGNASKTHVDSGKKTKNEGDILDKVECSLLPESFPEVTRDKARRFDRERLNRYWRKKRKKEQSTPSRSSVNYRNAVVKEIRRYIRLHKNSRAVDKKYLRKISRRADRIEGCARHVEVLRCYVCKMEQPGSGEYSPKTLCHSRFCPICSEIRSYNFGKRLMKIYDRVQEIDGYEWSFITLTTKRKSRKFVGLVPSVPAYREAAKRLLKVTKKCWQSALRVPGAGLSLIVEPSFSGMLHVHTIYYGPRIDKAALDSEARKTDGFMGFSKIDSLRRYNREETSKAVQRAARYAAKSGKRGQNKWNLTRSAKWADLSPKVYEEYDRWHGLHPDVVPPRVAAHWEIATLNMKLTRNYGTFILKGEKAENEKAGKNTDNALEKCCYCGSPAEFIDKATRRTDCWIDKCIDLDKPAMKATVHAQKSQKTKKKSRK